MGLARGTYPHPLDSVPILVRESSGSFAAASGNGTYLAYPGGIIQSTVAGSALAIKRLDPARFPAKDGYKRMLIIRQQMETNDVAPGNITLTGKLWASGGSSGATGTGPKATVGSLVNVAAVTSGISNPGADATLNDASAFFNFPAAGAFILGTQLTGGPAAAGSNFTLQLLLEFAYMKA